jgi:hypothetical protein
MRHRLSLKPHTRATAGRCILLVNVFVQVGEALQLGRTETLQTAQGTVCLHGINIWLGEVHGLTLVGGGSEFVVGVESVHYLGPGGGHTGSCCLSV